jgi:hypothetical protein
VNVVRPSQRAVRVAGHVALVVLTVCGAFVRTPAPAVAEAAELQRLGTVRMPFKPDDFSSGNIVGLDPTARRMYYLWVSKSLRLHASEYALSGTVPRLLRDRELGGSGLFTYDSYNTAVDSSRRRAYQAQPSSVTVVDLASLTIAATWQLAERVPGFAALGVTHSPEDHKVYVVGVTSPDGDTQDFAASANRTAAVLALDDTTGAMAWYRPIRECAEVLKLPKGGAWIGRSAKRDALYVFCTQTAAFGLYQGQSALLRVDLGADPRTAGTAEMVGTDVAVFPIGGAYKNLSLAGVAGLDPESERVFVQSQANTTPGAFVFDGHLDGWVGQVPAPSVGDYGAPTARGIDTASGRYYMATRGASGCTKCRAYLASTYGRSLPVQAGSVQFFDGSVTGMISVDPQTRRVFVPYLPNGADTPTILVFRDTAPPQSPTERDDYDAGTTGRAPTPSSFVFSDAASNAYGAQYVAIGGTGGIVPSSDNGGVRLPFTPAKGTRGLMTGRLSATDLSSGGAASAGSAVTGDTSTETEYETNSKQAWPYPKLSCLDGGGAPATPRADGNGGTVSLRCDLAKRTVTGHAAYGRTTAGPYSTTASEATTTITRDGRNGATTVTHAAARGIGVGLDGVGSVSIGAAESTVLSAATGVRGRATAAWSRRITGLVVRGPTGVVLYETPGCTESMTSAAPRGSDDCRAMIDQANRVLPDRIHLELPEPEVLTTPMGAFAGVGQTDADYYQARTVDDQGVTFASDSVAQRPVPALRVVTYNDGTERSRVVAQFAAVQASSILQVFAESPYPPPPTTPPTLPPLPTPLPTVGGPPTVPTHDGPLPVPPRPSPTAAPPVALPPERIGVEGLSGLLRRPLGEATLLALLLGLYATAAATAWRRRRLVRSLEEAT